MRSKAIKLTWPEVAGRIQAEIRKIIGRDILCEASADDETYWDVSFPLERIPLYEFYCIFETLGVTEEQRVLLLPPEEELTDSIDSLSLMVCQLLLRRSLGYDWECLHLTEDSLWILGLQEPPKDSVDFVKVGKKRFLLGALKSREEVLSYLREHGATHTVLADICEEYGSEYHNELCWHYPITDELHLGTFLLLVKEGVLSLPYNEADSVDGEQLCLEDARLCDAASMKLLISDWYRFDSDLRHAMEGMRRYYVYKEESCLRGLAE